MPYYLRDPRLRIDRYCPDPNTYSCMYSRITRKCKDHQQLPLCQRGSRGNPPVFGTPHGLRPLAKSRRVLTLSVYLGKIFAGRSRITYLSDVHVGHDHLSQLLSLHPERASRLSEPHSFWMVPFYNMSYILFSDMATRSSRIYL